MNRSVWKFMRLQSRKFDTTHFQQMKELQMRIPKMTPQTTITYYASTVAASASTSTSTSQTTLALNDADSTFMDTFLMVSHNDTYDMRK
jgi:hypothetical protein